MPLTTTLEIQDWFASGFCNPPGAANSCCCGAGRNRRRCTLDIHSRLGHVVLGCAVFLSPALLAQSTSGSNTSGSTSGGSGTTTTTSTSGSTSGGSSTTTGRQVSLHIPDESAPPGGIVQMKFLVTEPTPTTSGGPRVPVPKGTTTVGIELFNPNGDVDGVAMIGAGIVSIASISSTGAQGSDYPIMVVSLQLPPDISSGTKMSFTLDPSSTWTLGLLGTATVKPFPP